MLWSILLIKKNDNGWYINYIEKKLIDQIHKLKLENIVEVLVFEKNLQFYGKYVSVVDKVEISDNFISVIYNKLKTTDKDCIGLKGKYYLDDDSNIFNNISTTKNEILLPITKLNPIKIDIIFKLQNIIYYVNSEDLSNIVKTIDNISTPVIYISETKTRCPISIIITAYQSHKYIEECLDSIEKQSYFIDNDNFEVLVGVDGCQETLEKLQEIRHKYRNLHIFMMAENKGTYITTNTLIELSKNEDIIRFDSDDIMTTGLVKEVINSKKDNDIVILGYLDFENEQIGKELGLAGIIYFKKNVMNIAGGYQPWICAADTELINRVSNKVKVIQLKKALFYRRIHDNSLTRRKDTKHDSKIRNYYTNLIKTSDNKVVKIERIINKFTEIKEK